MDSWDANLIPAQSSIFFKISFKISIYKFRLNLVTGPW